MEKRWKIKSYSQLDEEFGTYVKGGNIYIKGYITFFPPEKAKLMGKEVVLRGLGGKCKEWRFIGKNWTFYQEWLEEPDAGFVKELFDRQFKDII